MEDPLLPELDEALMKQVARTLKVVVEADELGSAGLWEQ